LRKGGHKGGRLRRGNLNAQEAALVVGRFSLARGGINHAAGRLDAFAALSGEIAHNAEIRWNHFVVESEPFLQSAAKQQGACAR
jgi:hypothetical protein